MEEWRYYPGSNGKYKVSNTGMVLSKTKNGWNEIGSTRNDGYMAASINTDEHYGPIGIHRLVAQTFIPNPYNLPCVNHKDENKANNNVENLEWCTYQYNNTYGTKIDRAAKKQSESLRKPCEMIYGGLVIGRFRSLTEAYEKTGVSKSAISLCCRGYIEKANGYKWRYINKEVENMG